MLNRTTRTLLTTASLAAFAGLAQPTAGQDVTDTNITNHIDGEYLTSNAVDASRIGISTENGHVTLTGTVNNLLEKRRAEDIALATVGVTAVTNSIDVRRGDRPDGSIRDAAESALLIDPAADSYEIDVAVSDGTATLTGTVESYAEQQLAETVVAGVRGVTAVDNNITIDYETDRSDSEIQADITQRLAHTVAVDDGMLDVDVSNGDVTLSGTVGSAAEKWTAHDLAWVTGVESVTVDDVTIEWWTRDDMRRIDLYESASDESIRAAIKDALVYSPRVDASNPVVAVEDGIVTLTGTVDDLRARSTAEDLAEETLGVWDVNNLLRVSTTDAKTDEQLEADIRAALVRDAYVDRFDITVSVTDRHARLYGDVDTQFEYDHAEKAAESIDGVVDVSNYLTIADGWTIEDDWELVRDIQGELYWSPFVDSDDVTVVVDDGVATLSGTVDTFDERSIAAQNAYEGGARLVDNDLRVEYGPDELLP